MSFASDIFTVMPPWARQELGWDQIKALCDADDPIDATRKRLKEVQNTIERLGRGHNPYRSFLALEDAIKTVQKGDHIKQEEEDRQPTEQEMRAQIRSKMYKQSDLYEKEINGWMVAPKTDGYGNWKYEARETRGTGVMSSRMIYKSPQAALDAARKNL